MDEYCPGGLILDEYAQDLPLTFHLTICSLWQFRVLFANLAALFWYAYLASLGK